MSKRLYIIVDDKSKKVLAQSRPYSNDKPREPLPGAKFYLLYNATSHEWMNWYRQHHKFEFELDEARELMTAARDSRNWEHKSHGNKPRTALRLERAPGRLATRNGFVMVKK